MKNLHIKLKIIHLPISVVILTCLKHLSTPSQVENVTEVINSQTYQLSQLHACFSMQSKGLVRFIVIHCLGHFWDQTAKEATQREKRHQSDGGVQ